MSGNNLILVSSLAMLGVDVLTLGGGTAAKVMVKSSLKAGKKTMSIGGKALKSKVDDGLKIVKNKLDNVGKSLLDNNLLLNQGIRPNEIADNALLRSLESRGYVIDQSDEIVRHLDNVGANAGTFGTKDLLLRPDARKLEVLEEYLHNVQFKIGLQNKLSTGPTGGLEIHVKEFMLRHRRMLGLNKADTAWLVNWLSNARIINGG